MESSKWTREMLKAALNERSLMMREIEKKGFRRLVFACGAFLILKWAKTRLGGTEKSAGLLK